MPLAVAMEASDVLVLKLGRRIFRQNHLQILFGYLILLAVSRLVPISATSVTDHFLLARVIPTAHITHLILHVELVVHPVLFLWEVCKYCQRQILRLNQALDMNKRTIWSIGTKAKHVILADGGFIIPVPKHALDKAEFAKATFVKGARLLFFGGPALFGFGVAVHTRVFLVTVAILLEKLTNRHLVLDKNVEVLAVVALLARFLQPVNAHLLLAFVFIDRIVQTVGHGRHLVNRTGLIDINCPRVLSL